MAEELTLKEFVNTVVIEDIEWLEKQLPHMSPSLAVVTAYGLGVAGHEILSNAVKNDDIPEGERQFDIIGKKIEVMVEHLNDKYMLDDETDKKPTGNNSIINWLKSRNL